MCLVIVLLELVEDCMNIANYNGDFELHLWKDLEKQIRESSTYPFDDIWISWETEYPCLSILINGRYTCVHYFLNDQGDMWQSVGHGDIEVIFVSNGERSEMPANSVVSLDVTIECAKQFFETHKKPTCIEWRNL